MLRSVDDFHWPGNADTAPQALPSPIAHAQLWRFPLHRPASEIAVLQTWLAADEIARMRRYGSEPLQRRYVAGRATVRWLLGRRLNLHPAQVAIARGNRGRPQIAVTGAPDFNLSHTLGTALFGVCDAPGVRIGVDIEHGRRAINASGVARKFMAQAERDDLASLADDDQRRRALLRLWTCKEAMSKATGDALSAPFRNMEIRTTPALALERGIAPYLPARWSLYAIPVPDDFIATVALWQAQTIGAGNAAGANL